MVRGAPGYGLSRCEELGETPNINASAASHGGRALEYFGRSPGGQRWRIAAAPGPGGARGASQRAPGYRRNRLCPAAGALVQRARRQPRVAPPGHPRSYPPRLILSAYPDSYPVSASIGPLGGRIAIRYPAIRRTMADSGAEALDDDDLELPLAPPLQEPGELPEDDEDEEEDAHAEGDLQPAEQSGEGDQQQEQPAGVRCTALRPAAHGRSCAPRVTSGAERSRLPPATLRRTPLWLRRSRSGRTAWSVPCRTRSRAATPRRGSISCAHNRPYHGGRACAVSLRALASAPPA